MWLMPSPNITSHTLRRTQIRKAQVCCIRIVFRCLFLLSIVYMNKISIKGTNLRPVDKYSSVLPLRTTCFICWTVVDNYLFSYIIYWWKIWNIHNCLTGYGLGFEKTITSKPGKQSLAKRRGTGNHFLFSFSISSFHGIILRIIPIQLQFNGIRY